MNIVKFLAIIVSLFCVAINQAFAHVLKTDGTIGAVIHISPDDDPIIGQPAQFYFELKDTSNKFKIEDCECIASITQGTNKVFTQDLASHAHKTSLDTASFEYTFKTKGIYKIILTGKSYTNTFKQFEISHEIRIDRQSEQSSQSDKTQPSYNKILVGSTIAVLIVLVYKKLKR